MLNPAPGYGQGRTIADHPPGLTARRVSALIMGWGAVDEGENQASDRRREPRRTAAEKSCWRPVALSYTQSEASTVEFFGGYQVYSESGIDVTLLRERLKLTVTERWEDNARALAFVEALREASRARRAVNSPRADRRSG